ncbi:MAG: flagellar biosynthetic protein FliO [Gammaproteobacteria bacterium]|nr:flagellar biosynthetic protein FliO [Gammaproteobacteria bacterium]
MRYFIAILLILNLTPLLAKEAVAEKAVSQYSLGTSVISVVIALVFIILVIFACAWVLKKISGQSSFSSGAIKIKSAHMLGAKERLVIVEVDGKHLLLGVTPNAINKIEQLSDNCIPVTDKKTLPNFQEAFKAQLKKALGKKDEQ